MKVSDLLACVNEGQRATKKLQAYAKALEKVGFSAEVPMAAHRDIMYNVWRILDAKVEICD